MNAPELKQDTLIDGRYTLKEFKGSGSFGEVWLARDNELGVDIAVKLYISLDKRGQDEFKEEYKVAIDLNHENLLTAKYYGVWEHRPYLTMRYCSKGSVGKLGGKVNEHFIWKFIHDVSNGLRYLHSQEPPIIHQDIKPENILQDEKQNFLITDFGISKKLRTTMRKQSKRAIESGAIAYMGPERFLANPIAVKASDIWALGVSIYELATDDLPFMGQGGGMVNAGALLPELDAKWSRNLNDVMRACLAKETWDRPTAEELYEYSNEILKGKIISWNEWKKGDNQGDDQPVPKPTLKKWFMVGLGFIMCISLLFIIFNAGDKSDKENEEAIRQRYTTFVTMCENDINAGSAQNYSALLAAKSLIDSINQYRSAYLFLYSDTVMDNYLEDALTAKISEASAQWERAAVGQLEVAEDISAGVMYYQIAARLDNSQGMRDKMGDVSRRYGCKAIFMAVNNAEIVDDKLIIDYTGLNSSTINNVNISYGFGNPYESNEKCGEESIEIEPGIHQIEFPLSRTTDENKTINLYNNGILFYTTLSN